MICIRNPNQASKWDKKRTDEEDCCYIKVHQSFSTYNDIRKDNSSFQGQQNNWFEYPTSFSLPFEFYYSLVLLDVKKKGGTFPFPPQSTQTIKIISSNISFQTTIVVNVYYHYPLTTTILQIFLNIFLFIKYGLVGKYSEGHGCHLWTDPWQSWHVHLTWGWLTRGLANSQGNDPKGPLLLGLGPIETCLLAIGGPNGSGVNGDQPRTLLLLGADLVVVSLSLGWVWVCGWKPITVHGGFGFHLFTPSGPYTINCKAHYSFKIISILLLIS